MREEAFNAVGRGRDLWIGEVMEHIGQRSFNGKIRTAQELMGVPVPACGRMNGFFLKISFMAAVPVVSFPPPVNPVIVCSYGE